MPRLVQRDSSRVQLLLERLELERLLALLAEVLEALLLLVLEQVDGLDIGLDVFALGASPANFIVIGGDAGDFLEDPSPLVRGHRGESGNITLLHDVVAPGTQASLGHDSAHLGCRGGFVVDPVRGDGVALPA